MNLATAARATEVSKNKALIHRAMAKLRAMKERSVKELLEEPVKRLPQRVRLLVDDLRSSMEREARSGGSLPGTHSTVEHIDNYLLQKNEVQSFEQYRALSKAYLNAPTLEEKFLEKASLIIKTELTDKKVLPYNRGKLPREERVLNEYMTKRLQRRARSLRIKQVSTSKEGDRDLKPTKKLSMDDMIKLRGLYTEIGPPTCSKTNLAKQFRIPVADVAKILRSKRLSDTNKSLLSIVEEMEDQDLQLK